MRAAVWLTMALIGSLLAGCISTDDGSDDEASEPTEFFAPSLDWALWDDPQQFPHPGFAWPTITNVPEDAPYWWRPIDPVDLPEPIAGFEHISRTGDSSAGDGIAIFGKLLISPGWGVTDPSPTEIYNISDPENPELLSSFTHEVPLLNVNVIPYPDGRLIAVMPTFSPLFYVFDITDPTQPEQLAAVEIPGGSHTVNVVPGTPILYNGNTAGSMPIFPFHDLLWGGETKQQTEIFDLTDPENPVLLDEWENGYGCHAISFHITDERQRAYCAGHDAVQIWDIEDPRVPRIITTFPMPHGMDSIPSGPYMATIAHWAVLNRDASVLAIADETGGGFAAACDAHIEGDGGSTSGPFGNLWFYDIRDETQPELMGWISPGPHFAENPPPHGFTPQGSCTAHIGRMVPDEERDLLVMSYYSGGVGLVDFTDPSAPFFVDRWVPTGQPSDVWYYNGYVFAGDIDQGLDVLRFV